LISLCVNLKINRLTSSHQNISPSTGAIIINFSTFFKYLLPHNISSTHNIDIGLYNLMRGAPGTLIKCKRSGGSAFFSLQAIQDVHMKCIPFYSNDAHELKGTGMKTKRI
jgi:hypothetical protein